MKVVCINNACGLAHVMKIGKIYNLSIYNGKYIDTSGNYTLIINNDKYWFNPSRFVTLQEFRKQKLKRILKNES
jgi:hypothetical protein